MSSSSSQSSSSSAASNSSSPTGKRARDATEETKSATGHGHGSRSGKRVKLNPTPRAARATHCFGCGREEKSRKTARHVQMEPTTEADIKDAIVARVSIANQHFCDECQPSKLSCPLCGTTMADSDVKGDEQEIATVQQHLVSECRYSICCPLAHCQSKAKFVALANLAAHLRQHDCQAAMVHLTTAMDKLQREVVQTGDLQRVEDFLEGLSRVDSVSEVKKQAASIVGDEANDVDGQAAPANHQLSVAIDRVDRDGKQTTTVVAIDGLCLDEFAPKI